MPAGDKECQPVASERAATQAEKEEVVREEVEGGRERWDEDKEGEGRRIRRKRKVKTTVMNNDGQIPPQFYSEVAPVHQLQNDDLQHEVSSNHKRQRLDEYDGVLPPVEQYGGTTRYDDVVHDDVGENHQDDIHDDAHGNTDSGSGEDIKSVVRRQEAELTDVLTKYEEALSEGVDYEALFPARIDEMLRAAQNLLQSLTEQKRILKERLQVIMDIL